MSDQPGLPAKRCPSCGLIKPLEQFYRNASRPDGRVHLCKPCWSQYQKERRLARRYLDALDVPPDAVPDDMKRCSGCGRVLPLDSFRPNKGKPKGRAAYCNDCDPQTTGLTRARQLIGRLVDIFTDDELKLERKRFQQKSYRLLRIRSECAVLNCHKPGLYHHMNYIDPEAVVPLCEDHHLDLHRFERLVRKVARLLGIRIDDFVNVPLDLVEPFPPAVPDAPPTRTSRKFPRIRKVRRLRATRLHHSDTPPGDS